MNFFKHPVKNWDYFFFSFLILSDLGVLEPGINVYGAWGGGLKGPQFIEAFKDLIMSPGINVDCYQF